MRFASGQDIHGYVVEQFIAEGGTSDVYRVRDASGLAWALKVPQTLRREMRDRYVREAMVQARVEHPNVVQAKEIVWWQGRPCLVCEWVDGPTLEMALPTLGQDAAIDIARGVAAGLDAIHAAGLVHRDIKPANILLARSGPKIADFGIAKRVGDPSLTESGMTLGTPHYMSPEQVQDAAFVDARSDVYSFGLVLYELMAKCRAYPGRTSIRVMTAILAGSRIPLSRTADECWDVQWIEAAEWALSQEVQARPASCGQVIRHALRTPVAQATGTRAANHRWSLYAALATAAALVLAVLGGVVTLWAQPSHASAAVTIVEGLISPQAKPDHGGVVMTPERDEPPQDRDEEPQTQHPHERPLL